MNALASVSRTLIVLLVLRVLASPIALPDSPRHQAHTQLVVRVCVWTAQRPQRPALAETAGGRLLRGWDDASTDPVLAAAVRDRTPLGRTRMASSALLTRSGVPLVHVHVSDVLRC
jgi:hypothetical protein